HPIDFPKHATRLKRTGTALRRGDEVLVTKVKVKKDLIEFQLAGGGYGTFGDDDNPNVFVPAASKTEREKNLEKDLEKTTDSARNRRRARKRPAGSMTCERGSPSRRWTPCWGAPRRFPNGRKVPSG